MALSWAWRSCLLHTRGRHHGGQGAARALRVPFCSEKIVLFRGGGSQWTDLGWKPTKMVKPNEAMLLPSEDVGFLAILGEFWSWVMGTSATHLKRAQSERDKGHGGPDDHEIASKMILTLTPASVVRAMSNAGLGPHEGSRVVKSVLGEVISAKCGETGPSLGCSDSTVS